MWKYAEPVGKITSEDKNPPTFEGLNTSSLGALPDAEDSFSETSHQHPSPGMGNPQKYQMQGKAPNVHGTAEEETGPRPTQMREQQNQNTVPIMDITTWERNQQ